MNASAPTVGNRLLGHCPSCSHSAAAARNGVLRTDALRRHRGQFNSGMTAQPNRNARVRAEGGQEGVDPKVLEMQEKMKEQMSDPRVQAQVKAMEEAMKRPEVRQQMENTMAYMRSEEMQKKMEALREDDELKPMFEELKTGGMQAFMKYFSDQEMMLKLSAKLGPPPASFMGGTGPPSQSQATSAPPPKAPAEAEINNLVDAARFNDLEAVEDFLAIGKDPNTVDDKGRTALHFAVALGNVDIIDALLGAQANLEIRDSMQNTPLHYAAGYGRKEAVGRLLDAGADGGVKNNNGSTPADLARASPENPVGQDEYLTSLLDEAASRAPAFQDQ